MPFQIIRNNIAEVETDAIVNTANPRPVIGSGTDAAIHHKTGPRLLEARKKIGAIPVGQCALTPGFDLRAKWVIHTIGPIWQGGMEGEEMLLRQCYENALTMAAELDCASIAFPMISTGNYGFPKKEALRIVMDTVSRFLMDHEMHIYLVVWDEEAFLLSRSLFFHVQSYIDEHYIDAEVRRQRTRFSASPSQRQRMDRERLHNSLTEAKSALSCTESVSFHAEREDSVPIPPPMVMSKCAKAEAVPTPSLDELLENTDAGFTETLLKLIDQTGKKDSEIYKKANVSKQHFSKIRNNPDYKPTKATALAFAIALELDLTQTEELIGRAGYALTRSSKFDVIIMYFISRKNYDMFEINMTLFEFDQMTLGV